MAFLDKDIINIEGGYSNDPDDHDGETKYGITKAEYPHLDIANLTFDQALEIYQRDYWDKNRIGEINTQAVADLIFILIVNSGAHEAITIVQRACNLCGSNINVDGQIGEVTLRAINGSNQGWLMDCIRISECHFYLDIVARDSTQLKYFHGWINRALLY